MKKAYITPASCVTKVELTNHFMGISLGSDGNGTITIGGGTIGQGGGLSREQYDWDEEE